MLRQMLRWIVGAAPLVAGMLVAGVVASAVAASNKTLPIDADLRANADVLKVSMRAQMPNSIWDFKFGEFAVVSSKFGVTETTKTHKLFSLIEHSRTKQKFSFVMRGAGPAIAKVKAAQIVEADAFRDVEVSPGVYVGMEASSGVRDNLVALIVTKVRSTCRPAATSFRMMVRPLAPFNTMRVARSVCSRTSCTCAATSSPKRSSCWRQP
jgi:hypothetical protein